MILPPPRVCAPSIRLIVDERLMVAVRVEFAARVNEQLPVPVHPLAPPVPLHPVNVPLVAVTVQTTLVPDA